MVTPRATKPRIAVYEAYDGLREAFSLMLEDWAAVRFLASAEACVTACTQDSADLMILDVDGHADPLALVQRVRKVAPQAKVLLVAGEFDYEFQVACVKLGQISFLTKPFSAPAAVEKMQVLLGLAVPSIRTRVVRIALT